MNYLSILSFIPYIYLAYLYMLGNKNRYDSVPPWKQAKECKEDPAEHKEGPRSSRLIYVKKRRRCPMDF